ncbi:MAG TPA: hypothetical protein VN376_08680 [Longilinea sp.]|nr:hypothetical protein [Longilinea sp.]
MTTFSSRLPIIVFTRPADQPKVEWAEGDRGPGYFQVENDQVAMVRVKNIGNKELAQLVGELVNCKQVISLNLAENRKITDAGLEVLKDLPWLTDLNLGACDITNDGLEHLKALPHLERLSLIFCNRISDEGMRTVGKFRNLEFLDILGCVHITHSGIDRYLPDRVKLHKGRK